MLLTWTLDLRVYPSAKMHFLQFVSKIEKEAQLFLTNFANCNPYKECYYYTLNLWKKDEDAVKK